MSFTMNKHQVTGRVEEAKGAIKEAAGKLVGNEKLQAEGAIEKHAAKAQAKAGDIANKLKKAAE